MKPLTCCLLVAVLSLSAKAKETPNIIVIMADDLGYGDVSCNGSKTISTPNIDRLASEGIRFTSGYCSASTCTPTRFSLLTGTYAFREKGTGVAAPNAPAVIRPGTPTIASMLKGQGYATAVIGKWHLGLGDQAPDWNGKLQPGPLEIGFDHCFILPTTNDRVPQVIVEDHRVRNLDTADPLWVGNDKPSEDHPTGISNRSELKMDWNVGHNGTIHNGISRIGFYTGGTQARFRDEDLADEWVRATTRWIEAHQGQPFFLFFASHDIHVPRAPHERFVGKSGQGPRGDSILEFDWSVGEILATLDRLGLSENTLLVLCSDNGPVLDDGYKDQSVDLLGDHRPAGPYQGGKYSVWEGGTRTPFLVRWKGRVQPGVSDQVVCTIDLAASFAALTGASLPDDGFLDSFNLLSALLGEPDARGRDHLIQQDNAGKRLGLRSGPWKLVRQPRGGNRLKGQDGGTIDSLFNLMEDAREQKDLANSNPEQLQRMRGILEHAVQSRSTRPQ